MREFIEFVQKMHVENYPRLMQKMQDDQIPIAVFASLRNASSINGKNILINKLFAGGFNLQYYFTPSDPESEKFPQYPKLKIVNVSTIKNLHSLPKYVFILGDFLAAAFVDRFAELGIEMINYVAPEQGFRSEFYISHLPEIFEVYQMLNDEESRRIFLAFILGNASFRISDCIFDEMPQYFLHGFMPQSGDILIDGGAFDGSSGSMFKKYGCEVYSFELDSRNYETAKIRGDSEGFVVENFGLGEHSRQIEYLENGFGSAVGNFNFGEEHKKIGHLISIDEYVREKKLPRIDFIKLDVEGSELDTLKGAAVSIVKWKPRLAISAYHKNEDSFKLAKFLKKIRPDYEFAFRHYATSYDNEPDLFGRVGKEFLETFNLTLKIPFFWESVLYAR